MAAGFGYDLVQIRWRRSWLWFSRGRKTGWGKVLLEVINLIVGHVHVPTMVRS